MLPKATHPGRREWSSGAASRLVSPPRFESQLLHKWAVGDWTRSLRTLLHLISYHPGPTVPCARKLWYFHTSDSGKVGTWPPQTTWLSLLWLEFHLCILMFSWILLHRYSPQLPCVLFNSSVCAKKKKKSPGARPWGYREEETSCAQELTHLFFPSWCLWKGRAWSVSVHLSSLCWGLCVVEMTCVTFNCHLKCLQQDHTMTWQWSEKFLCVQKDLGTEYKGDISKVYVCPCRNNPIFLQSNHRMFEGPWKRRSTQKDEAVTPCEQYKWEGWPRHTKQENAGLKTHRMDIRGLEESLRDNSRALFPEILPWHWWHRQQYYMENHRHRWPSRKLFKTVRLWTWACSRTKLLSLFLFCFFFFRHMSNKK